MTVPGPAPAPMQTSLFGAGEPAVDRSFAGVERIDLAHGAWVEYLPDWLAGELTVFDHLVGTTEWHAHRRPMYDRMVDVPRLTAQLPRDGPGHPVLDEISAAVSARYDEPCERIGLAWYRDGRDSVAPHGDQVARTMDVTTMAIVSCGDRRRFHLTPAAGGETGLRGRNGETGLRGRNGETGLRGRNGETGLRGPNGETGLSLELGHGDLLVLGGTIQRTWRHGVPKTNRAVGPRLSIMFRPPWLA